MASRRLPCLLPRRAALAEGAGQRVGAWATLLPRPAGVALPWVWAYGKPFFAAVALAGRSRNCTRNSRILGGSQRPLQPPRCEPSVADRRRPSNGSHPDSGRSRWPECCRARHYTPLAYEYLAAGPDPTFPGGNSTAVRTTSWIAFRSSARSAPWTGWLRRVPRTVRQGSRDPGRKGDDRSCLCRGGSSARHRPAVRRRRVPKPTHGCPKCSGRADVARMRVPTRLPGDRCPKYTA